MNVSLEEYVDVISSQPLSNTAKDGTDKTRIAYYMDPLNFLNEQNVFMFLDLTRYNAADHTEGGVSGTWISKTDAVCTPEQMTAYILSAGKSLTMNSYFITSRAAIESAYGTSNLSKGKAGSDGKLYYNFYGIGATDADPTKGTTYAQKRGWDTPYRSVVEGANWINDQYLLRGKNTAYFFRFYPYRQGHIYMSDLSAPKTESALLYKAYAAADKLEQPLHFIIPVFTDQVDVCSNGGQHTWQETERVAPTCVKAGKVTYTCHYGDATKTEDISATGVHVAGDWQVVKEATYTASGTQVKQCKTCGTVLGSQSIPRLQDTKLIFSDISKTDWFYKNGAINYVYNHGLFGGTSDTTFEPDTNMTRGMFVTVLGRLSGVAENKKATTKFTDVKKGQYYTGYVKWASDAGIVNGTSATKFEPNANVTREQICKMMVGYCKYEGITLKNINKAITFKDAAKISGWAKTYVTTCQKAGLVSGEKSGTGYIFNPGGNATRAQVATIMYNFAQNYL